MAIKSHRRGVAKERPTSRLPALPGGMFAHWRLDKNTPTGSLPKLYDESGNGRNLSWVGTQPQVVDLAANEMRVVDFNLNTGAYRAEDATPWNHPQMTMIHVANRWGIICGRGDSTKTPSNTNNQRRAYEFLGGDGGDTWSYRHGGDTNNTLTQNFTSTVPGAGFAAFTYRQDYNNVLGDGDRRLMRFNGLRYGVGTVSSADVAWNTSRFNLGRTFDDTSAGASICRWVETLWWDRALTNAELDQVDDYLDFRYPNLDLRTP